MIKPTIIWTDQSLILDPAVPFVMERLSYGHREINREDDSIDVIKTDLYSIDDAGRLVTFQGLMQKILKWLRDAGVPFDFYDARVFRHKPMLHLMKGFRGSQRQFTIDGLMLDQSGVFQAPTRWGKSKIIENIIRAYPRCRIVVTAPGIDLLEQLEKDLRAALPDREIVGLYSGSKSKFQGDDITIVSMDSLFKCDHLDTDLVVIDEPHSVVTDSRGIHLDKFRNARRLAVGATIDGRFDGADILVNGLIGPTLVRRTFAEGVAEGAICPIDVVILDMPFSPASRCEDRDEAYRRLVFQNAATHSAVALIANKVIPKEWQTIAFIANEKQADMLKARIPDSAVAMAKRMNKTDRQVMFGQMKRKEILRCLASGIYSTGVTFSGIRSAFNCNGGGASISVIQKVGRLAEVIPGKRSGLFFDFMFRPSDINPDLPFSMIRSVHKNKGWYPVWRDSHARLNLYRNTGYNVHLVKTIPELALLFKRLH